MAVISFAFNTLSTNFHIWFTFGYTAQGFYNNTLLDVARLAPRRPAHSISI